MKWRAYPKYKDSGVEWLGKVPEHWDVLRVKNFFEKKKEINKGMKCENRLALTMNGVIPRNIDDVEGLQSSDYETYQIFEKGDIAFKLIDLENIKTSRVAFVPECGIMSPAYLRLKPLNEDIGNFGYWYFMFLYWDCIFNSFGGGVRQSLSAEELGIVAFLSPSVPEQIEITSFLDRETAKIDTIIQKQEKLIELLQEKRKALISHAVTKGLNPDAPMKDSGVEWLEVVPEHWNILPLKRMAKVQLSNVDKHVVEGEQTIKLCNYIDVYKNERITADMDFMVATASDEQIRRLALKKDDVIITKDSESPDDIGVPGLVSDCIEGVVCGYHLSLLRSFQGVSDGAYLANILRSSYVKAVFTTLAVGMTRYGLGKYEIENIVLPLPPIDEQSAIASFLDREISKIDTLIEKSRRSIELIKERRSALISAAVTGKIDVREAV